jgi:hypothetical protein
MIQSILQLFFLHGMIIANHSTTTKSFNLFNTTESLLMARNATNHHILQGGSIAHAFALPAQSD